jgi:hypothetical protein
MVLYLGEINDQQQAAWRKTLEVFDASGVTSKPTIEGRFKTDQWTSTLDDFVLPYQPAVWQPRALAPMPVL